MTVGWRREALDDLRSIHDYIARDNTPAAKLVIARIREATRRLYRFPLSGRRGAVDGTHELVITGAPYIIVYVASGQAVEIIAVFHTAEDRNRGPA